MIVVRPGSFFVDNYEGANPGDISLDSSRAIQSTLQDAEGVGGDVYLSGREYALIDTDLVIPPNVTLHGTYPRVPSHTTQYNSYWGEGHDISLTAGGTVIVPRRNAGNPDAAAAITGKTNSGARGFALFYADQIGPNSPDEIIAFPPSFGSRNTNNLSVEDIEFINSYIALAIHQSHRGQFHRLQGQPLFKGIILEGGGDVNRLSDIHWGAMYTFDTSLWNKVMAGATGYVIGREDYMNMRSCFAFGYGIAHHFVELETNTDTSGPASGPTSAWCELDMCGSDFCSRNIVVDQGQDQSIMIRGGQFTNQSQNYAIQVASSFAGKLHMLGGYVYQPYGKYLNVDGKGSVRFDNFDLSAHYDTDNATGPVGSPAGVDLSATTGIIAAGNGDLTISRNKFFSDQPQMNIGSNIRRYKIENNDLSGFTKRIALNGNTRGSEVSNG